jgi:hypothetical protein
MKGSAWIARRCGQRYSVFEDESSIEPVAHSIREIRSQIVPGNSRT